MACGPRTYNLRNRALDVRLHTPSLLMPLPHYVFRKKRGGLGLPKKSTEKKRRMGCARGLTWSYHQSRVIAPPLVRGRTTSRL